MTSASSNHDAIVDEFEAEWRSGSQPELPRFLQRVPENEKRELAKLLIPIDIEYRFKRGDDVVAGDYEVLGSNYRRIVEDAMASQFENRNNDTTKTVDHQAKTSKSRVIGNYKLLQKLGEGGMGTVWMAEQEKPVRRRVALKLIKAGHDSKEVVARFEAERQALAMMDHHNIAKVLDGGTTETGQPYFVMELVQGIPFNKYCDQHKLSINERLDLFVPICNAVQHAHQKGIIHRDLKPSNILVSLYDGKPVPKVIDFGLAKALQHQSKLTDKTLFTEFGQVVGTLQYMSPEQAEMNQLDVDTRTDIYSLGVILYELLTGSTPIDAETLKNQAIFKVLESIREKEPPRPSARLSSSTNESVSGISQQRQIDPSKLKNILRGELDWIVMKALEKDRSRRYETANGFAEDVSRFLAGDIVVARPPTYSYRIRKYLHRHTHVVLGLGIIFSILIIGITSTTFLWIVARKATSVALRREIDANHQRAIADTARVAESDARLEASENAKRYENARDEALKSLSRTRYLLANSMWEQARATEARKQLESIAIEHQNLEWHLSRHRFQGSNFVLVDDTGEFVDAAIDPDGKSIGAIGNDGSASIWNMEDGERQEEFRPRSKCTRLILGSNNSKILIGQNRIEIHTNSTPKEIQNFECATSLTNVVCTIDRRKLYYSSQDTNACHVLNMVDGTTRKLFESPNAITHLAVGQDGLILVGLTKDAIQVHNAETGERLFSIPRPSGLQRSFIATTISPDSRTLATASEDGMLKFWELSSGKLIHQFPIDRKLDIPIFPDRIQFSPDGGLLSAIFPETGVIKLWESATGDDYATLVGHGSGNPSHGTTRILFSADASKLVTLASGEIRVWDLTTFTNQMVISASTLPVTSLSFSQDGSELITNSQEGPKIWSTRSGLFVRSLPGLANRRVNALAFTDSQDSIAIAFDNEIAIVSQQDGRNPKAFGYENSATFNEPIAILATTKSNDYLAATNYKEVVVWDTKDSAPLFSFQESTGYSGSLAFSSDSRLLSWGGHLLDTKSKKQIAFVRLNNDAPSSIFSSAFSNDNQTLALGGYQRIELYKVQNLESRFGLAGHKQPVTAIDFSPDDSRIASGASDGTVRLWDTRTGDELLTLREHGAGIRAVKFSPDGSLLASSDQKGNVILRSCAMRSTAMESAFRKGKSIVQKEWHHAQAVRAESRNDDFATLFHRAYALKMTPSSIVDYYQFKLALKRYLNRHGNNSLPTYAQEADKIDLPLHGDPEILWKTAIRFASEDLVMANELRVLSIKNHSSIPTSVTLQNARAIWLIGQAIQTSDKNLEEIGWSFAPKDCDRKNPLISTPWMRRKDVQELFERISGLGFHVHTFDARLNGGEIEIQYVWSPNWISNPFWYMKSYVNASEFDSFNNLRLSEGYELIKSTKHVVSGTEFYAGLWHRSVSRLKSFEKLKNLNTQIRNRSKDSNEELLTENELNEFAELCNEFSLGRYYSTLGVAQFRSSAFTDAIEALEVSLNKTPKEMNITIPHPRDLAFLAMSHLRLNHEKEAREFHSKFQATMQLDAFKNDEECLGFAKEVELAFQAFAPEGGK